MAEAVLLGQATWRVGRVVALHNETPTARTIAFHVPDWPGHGAGQHVDVGVTTPDGYSGVRSYSIASAPNATKHVELTVERHQNGNVSSNLMQNIAVGDRVELRGPIGRWFVWRTQQIEPIQLLAGGAGLVPLMAMIRSRGAAGSTVPFRLLYSVREPGAVLYRDELHTRSDHDVSAGSLCSMLVLSIELFAAELDSNAMAPARHRAYSAIVQCCLKRLAFIQTKGPLRAGYGGFLAMVCRNGDNCKSTDRSATC